LTDFNILKLGNALGNTSKTLSNTKQDYIESDDSGDLNIVALENIKVHDCILISKNTLGTGSFVLDHPIYSDLDSSILSLDGDYTLANERLFVLCNHWDHFTSSEYIDGGTTATIDTTNKKVIF
jgi:hypothetical protein